MSDQNDAAHSLLNRLREQLDETFDDDGILSATKERLSRALAEGKLSLPQGATFEDLTEILSPDKHRSATQARLDGHWSQICNTVKAATKGDIPERRDRLDRTRVASLRTKLFSAYTVRAGEDYLVIYDLAMHDLMYSLIKLALSCWDVASVGGSEKNENPDLRTAPAVAARVARVMMSHYKWEGYLWAPISVNLPMHAWHLAVEAIEAAETFILAHEAAHILLGDLEDDKTRRVAVVGMDVETENCRGEREFLADCLAANLAFNPGAESAIDETDFFVRTLGAFAFFQAADLYEKAYFLHPPGTHPDPLARFHMMWEVVLKDKVNASQTQRLFDFLKIISKLCDDVRTRPERKDLDVPLKDLVDSSPLLDLETTMTDEDLTMMGEVEKLDYYIGMPAMNHLASIARAAYGNEIVDTAPAWFHRATVRALKELEDSSPEIAAFLASSAAIKFYELAAIGSRWLMRRLPQELPVDECVALFSPSPGKPYSTWSRELREAIGEAYTMPLLGIARIHRSGNFGYFPMSDGYEWVTDLYVDEYKRQKSPGEYPDDEVVISLSRFAK